MPIQRFFIYIVFIIFLASDSEANIKIYMYQSECNYDFLMLIKSINKKAITILFKAHDNQGGQWFIPRSEFHVGSHINSMFRLKCKVNDPSCDKRSNLADKRQVTYCCKPVFSKCANFNLFTY